MNAIETMSAAVTERPFDEFTRQVLADALEEDGQIEQAEKERSGEALTEWLESQIHRGADAAKSALKSANGKRRERIRGWANVIGCVERAIKNGYAYSAGDTVTNSYGYRSYRTCIVAAKRTDGTIRVGIGVGNATKGSSPINPAIDISVQRNQSNLAERLREWADRA